MRVYKLILCVTVLSMAGVGCASNEQSFRPTERVEGRTVEGYREAFYDLSVGNMRYGQVKVWSRGARRVDTPAGHRTVVHIGFTIDNTSQQQIELDLERVRLESLQTQTPLRTDVHAVLVAGNPVIPPDSSKTVEIEFELPGDLRARDLRAFRVKWSTMTDGQTFTEYTPFVQQNEEYAYIPVYAYYYPYYPWDYPFYDPYYFTFHRPRVVIVAPYPRRVIVRGQPRPRSR